jgi:glyoxylate reductase
MVNKVLVTGTSVAPKLLEPLKDAGLDVVNPTYLLSEGDLASELADSVAYLLGGDEYASEAAVKDASDLKVIAFLGVGYESFIDVSGATKCGIAVTNTPGTLTNSVAEFTISHLLNARRHLTAYINGYRAGRRQFEAKQKDIAGHKVGIVGLGTIGTRIAELLTAGFNAEVSYFSRTRKRDEEKRLGISYLPLDDLASNVDALIVMVPGNDTTRGLIGADVIDKFKQGTLLVNTARPEVVDVVALKSGLASGKIATAAFDGFYEGEDGDAFIKTYGDDRLLVTGHIASLTDDARDGMAKLAVDSIINVVKTGTDKHIVNR